MVCRITVHRLAARTLIRSLEMEEGERGGEQVGEVKKKVVKLSVQSGVSSAFTAFIAVNKNLLTINCTSIEHHLTPRTPLLQLVSLQKASGCWVLDPALAAALGKTSKEVKNTKPSAVKHGVWATILALIWLHGFKMDAQEEWKLLAMKAVSWLCAQNALCVTECVEAGNALLGCSVQKDALGF
ncbi:von Willebrand factor A domain-containing protein 5A-like [Sander vitreus]